MSRVARTTVWTDVIDVHRLRFPMPVIYLCYATWGAVFAVSSARELFTWPVFVAAAVNVLLLLAGLALNTVADVRSDERHQDKNRLARAVRRVSRERTGRWVAIEISAGLALSVVVGLGIGRWTVTVAAAGIVVLHLLYNIEPVRLKHRGFVGALAFGTATPGLACLVSYGAVRSDVGMTTALIFVGVAVLSMGRTAWWSVPDVSADAGADAGTPAVRHGVRRAAARSCMVMLVGLVCLAWGLWARYGPVWAGVGTAAHVVVLLIALAPAFPCAGSTVPPGSALMRRQVVPLVTAGEVALLVVALIRL